MAKWFGLSLDPDLHKKPTTPSYPYLINNSHHFKLFHHPNTLFNFDHHHHPLLFSPPPPPLLPSSSISSKSCPILDMESTIQFPLNLNCNSNNHDDDDGNNNKNTLVIHDEMDFFADHKNKDTSSSSKNIIIGASSSDADAAAAAATAADLSHLDFNVNTGLHLANTSSDQSIVDDGISPHSDDKRVKSEVAVLQAELERMNSENRRLKESLNQVTNDYTNLQMHLMTMMQQQQQHDHQRLDNCVGGGDDNDRKLAIVKCNNQNGLMLPRQFTDLALAAATATATIAATAETDETSLSSSDDQSGGGGGGGGGGGHQHSRTRSPMNNNVEARSDDSPDKGSQGWGPNKVPRLNQSSKSVDQATEATMRKARVSVRARSEAPMITDGCQWRKYGQKMAKGNPCPRAYYRCTMAAGCPVRKQVQRCAEDRTILITTYEGNHTHPLPPAAMAMASTTSSAARMLLSGSMPSADGLMNSNFLARTLLPCSSNMATISASAPFPTVTLDLTQNPITSPFQRSPNQFQLPFPNGPQNLLNNPAAALLPQIFGQALYNQSKFSGLQMSQDSDNTTQLGHQNSLTFQQNPLADTVNAIAADPNFTAALAAAITSLIGSPHSNTASNNAHNGSNNNNNNNGSVTTSNNNGMNSSFQGGRE